MSKTIAIYGSHDCNVCVEAEGKYRVFELERLTGIRFDRIDKKEDFKSVYQELARIIKEETGQVEFSKCLHQQVPFSHLEYLRELWRIDTFKEMGHHISHAANSYYQSPFDKALIISYDGGGFEGFHSEDRIAYFNIYLAEGDAIKKIASFPYDLGGAYGLLAVPLVEVFKTEEDWRSRFLSFAGKVMGLVAYGKVNHTHLEAFKIFYKEHKHLSLYDFEKTINDSTGLKMGVNTHSGEEAYMIAATSQRAFEEVAWEAIQPHVERYCLPVVIAGGCGLNVLFNEQLKASLSVPLFIPPNPSDCGLSFGMMMTEEPVRGPIDLMYSGFPILDKCEIDLTQHPTATPKLVAEQLAAGKVIGVLRGNSEHGPRALGNRSLLCSPMDPLMKDRLNQRVKFREPFRPFAPMVREEDVGKYFDTDGPHQYMSFSPIVNEAYRGMIPAVVHKDSTARVQTVTKESNRFIYDVLGEFEKLTGVGVLLNTSFNIKGKPILTKIMDALEVMETTEVDGVVVEDRMILK
jgi:carbamoyltransferase